MSASQQGNQSPPTWTEPPWSGWIETTGDALLILEAARRGLIPRVTRRLVDSERKMITSGSVFVFDEDESGIKRWTDGFFWSPSRILGNFLLYRETDKRGSSHRSGKDTDTLELDGTKNDGSLSRPKTDPGHPGVDKHRERTLVGSLTNSYKFKPDGLMKKTFSLTIGGVAQHLISYYKIEDVESGRLRPPSSLPELASLEISQEYLDKTHFRNPPKVEVGADGVLRYRGEADDIENSPSLLTGPPLTELPLITEGRRVPESAVSKRSKRFEPLLPTAKRRRGGNSKDSPVDSQEPQLAQSQQEGTSGQIASPTTQQQIQAQGYPDANTVSTSPPATTAPTPPYTSFGVAPYYPVHGYMQPPPPHVSMYPHQAPYPAVPQTQPPPTHPGQYPYTGYPVPIPGSAPPSAQTSPPSSGSTNTPISPSDSSHSQAPPPFPPTSPTQPQPPSQTQQPVQHQVVQVQPGYYHPPPHPYYPGPPHAPAGQPVYTPYPPPPHPAHAPPPPPTTVWAPPHPPPHPYAGYAPPPHPPQQYPYGVYGPPPQQPYVHPHAPQGYGMSAQKPENVTMQGQAQGAMSIEGKPAGARDDTEPGEESGD